MRPQLLVAAFVAAVPSASRLTAQPCDSVTSRTSLSAFAGAPIRSVRIVTQSPQRLPGVGNALDKLHVRTRDRTVRRQLLFAAGDTVDTLGVAESIRRLRRDRYLRDVELRGVRCRGAVDVVVTTRDDWSVKPKLQVRSAGKSELGLTERNLLGSGRELSLHVRTQQGRVGVGVALNDPWFLGSRVGAVISQDTYRDGSDLTGTLRLREETVLAPWGAELSGQETEYEPDGVGLDRFGRGTAHLLVRRRVFDTRAAVLSVLGGVESESSRLVAAPGAPIVGPSRASRNFVGVTLGVARASVAYDTLTWMLPNDAIVDVPLSFETEATLGLGRDAVLGAPMMHLDLWAGRAWIPSGRALAVADLWASGYASAGRWDAATFRAALAYYQAAKRGFWSTRVTAERLLNPDPDVRTFVTIDPTASLLPRDNRLAAAALGFTVERDVRLRTLTRSWALDGALFAAASSRWESVEPSPEHLDVATLGFGLRLTPARAGRATARLDVGLPVAGSSLARRGVYVGIGLSPWWGDDRHRAGRRD
ncbi:MAG TPA: hypothetical protein VM076_05070 [Gemmatimonadaceae bacterium]|nr:hypothetical protein [Gemmatimonadaceae bacterium]